MSECKYAGRTNPRVVPGRHDGACQDEACPGCAPCERAHCRVCGVAHDAGTCAECTAATREDLREIGRLCGALTEEVEHRGVNGEAMMLLGPAADWEARGHMEASVRAGRLDRSVLEISHARDCKNHDCLGCGELHPEFVLGGWDAVWRDALEHDDDGGYSLAEKVDYLDRTMGYMGTYPHVPFEDFAGDVRRCRAHLEAVLHDGEQIDRGAPCLRCEVLLVRTWAQGTRPDGWECPRCKRWYDEESYRRAVAHLHREEATHLTDRDMEIRTGVRAGTVRVWANRYGVERRQDRGRVVYSVADVQRVARDRGLAS